MLHLALALLVVERRDVRARVRLARRHGGRGASLTVCPYDHRLCSKKRAPLDVVMETRKSGHHSTSSRVNASVRTSLKVRKRCPRPATALYRRITWARVLVGVFQTLQVAAPIADGVRRDARPKSHVPSEFCLPFRDLPASSSITIKSETSSTSSQSLAWIPLFDFGHAGFAVK